MKNNKSLIEKFMEYAVGSIFTLLLGVISSPIITRMIEPNEYGKFSMFNLFLGISAIILTLGYDQSFVRFFYSEKNEENQRLLLRKTIKVPIIVLLIYDMLLIVFNKKISLYLFNEENILPILIIIANCFLALMNRYGLLVIRMKQNGKLYSIIQVLQKATYITFALALALLWSRSYLVLLVATLFSNLIITIMSIVCYSGFWFGKIEESIKLKVDNKALFRYGYPIMFTLVISWVFQSADKMCIKEFNDYVEVGIYAAAFTIISLLNQVQTTFITFWTPVSYEHYTKNSNDTEFYRNIFDIVAISMFLLTIGLILFKDIIVLLLGKQYRDASFVMPFLIFMPLMNTISEITVVGINFMKKTKYHIVITMLCSIVNVIGNIILVPYFGAKGAAITTGITYILFFIIRTVVANKLYKINFGLGKFYILTVLTIILAAYATFKNVNSIMILLSIFIIIVMLILYKDTFFTLYNELKSKLRVRKN